MLNDRLLLNWFILWWKLSLNHIQNFLSLLPEHKLPSKILIS